MATVFAYDANSNVKGITDGNGVVTSYGYDPLNRLVTYTDGNSGLTAYTYDPLSRLTAITTPEGITEAYGYDVIGNILSVTDGMGEKTSYSYDDMYRLIEKLSPMGAKESYTYDAHDLVTSVTDALGNVTTYDVNENGKVTAITQANDGIYSYTYDEVHDLNVNLIKVTDREGLETTYVYDAINRVVEIHRPNGISTYNIYNARNQIVELKNTCDDCEWVVSSYSYTYDDRGFIAAETAIEFLAGYAYDDKHDGKHEDGRHDDLYPHGTKHNGKHDKDADFAYQIVQTDRSFTYDDAGKLLSMTEDEENYGLYTTTYAYDLIGNRTAIVKTNNGTGKVAEYRKYVYNENSQVVKAEIYDGKKTTSMVYTYDADGNMISEIGKIGTDKVETYYAYAVENRLAAVYEADELLMAMAYDGDGNRVFQLNYNLHTDEDWKANSGNGNGSNKDNSGASDSSSTNSTSNGSGNTTNAEENTSQNQSGILFPVDSEVSDTEQGLIDLIKTTGKQKNYELIEYINDVNREYAEVLVEQNINGITDTSYVYGVDRLSLDRFDGSTGYYLYDPRGSVTGITNEEGQLYQSYRYGAYGEITFGAPQYENEYTYNGESYNPNIESQYLRARYYYVVTATFLTEDSYLGNIIEPLTLNRYIYCISSPLNYIDPSGHKKVTDVLPSTDAAAIWAPNKKKLTAYEVYKNAMEQSLGITDNSTKYSQFEDFLNSTKPSYDTKPSYGMKPSYGNKSPLYRTIDNAKEKIQVDICEEEGSELEALFKELDSYLQGNLSDANADKVLTEITGNQTLDVYKTSNPNNPNNYERYDNYIIGWTEYFNERLYKNSSTKINTTVIKAMLWKESKMGYYTSSSPNANVSVDILQVLDPRNPTIYEFCTYNLDTKTNVKILDGNGNYVFPYTIDPDYNHQKSGTTYNTPVADRLFNIASDGCYHYQYQNSSQLLSVALGIRTYAMKLDAANGNILDAAQEYNGSDHKVQYRNDVNDLAFNGGFSHADSYN